MHATILLRRLLANFVDGRGWTWPDKTTIEPPRDEAFGDLATNLAMVLAGQAKKGHPKGPNPRALAADLAAHVAGAPEVDKAEVAGPGFVNVTLAPSFWQAVVPEVVTAADGYGRTDTGAGRRVQVEYVSANPTGPLHIGHGRGAAVGDSLARVLRAAGFEVSTEYYINDAGRQMRLLGESVLFRARQESGQAPQEPTDWYKGDYVRDIAARLTAKRPDLLELPEADAVELCKTTAVDEIMAGIKTDLGNFRVGHEVWFSEKSLVDDGSVEATFARLRDKGLAYEADGALWMRTTEFGDDKDRVLRKSSGELTYFASDIAYHDHKYNRGFDLVVDIWGADHHGYVPRMKAAVQALGREADDLEVILVQLVNLLRDGVPVAMSTRAGQFETLADVVAETGADAARFMFLSRKSDSHLDFDLELVKQQTMDNPVYYVQYAHARISSVFRKAAERGVAAGDVAQADLTRLNTPEDLRLLKLMARLPEVVAQSAEHLSPHFMSFYLSELAKALHGYYTVHQVLASGDDGLTRARLHLLAAVAQVIRNGLDLLGVEAPQSM